MRPICGKCGHSLTCFNGSRCLWQVRRARVYSPGDVEELRKLIFYKGKRPETMSMVSKMRAMRGRGKTLATIGTAFGKTESYVSKLLKQE